MAVLRLAGGSDVVVKLSVQEVVAVLQGGKNNDAFVELQGEDAPILIRPSSVIAIIEDGKRGTTGFRIAVGESSSG